MARKEFNNQKNEIMKTKFNYLSVIALMAMAVGFLLVSCEKDDMSDGTFESSSGDIIALGTNGDESCYEWVCETAWADNECSKDEEPGSLRYVTRGNWATYVEYNGTYKDVSLYAGQTIEVGWVIFRPKGDEVEIEIGLFTKEVAGYPNAVIGWEFCPVEENIKIDGFNSLSETQINRTGNPVLGQFPYKYDATGTKITVTVPKFKYYGVHVEVGYEKEVECPEE